ncbi:MAG: PaaI family thioesterase [Desulfobulbaceae bacterium]|nr:MAG: PaaI family thioesterase [Desulfobulbaceae bacterium]
MSNPDHYARLARMYAAAPINAIYRPAMQVREREAEIEMVVTEQFFHSGGALHGSVYFKMLDDAAFFAANSCEPEFFVLTTAFTTYLTRPVSSGSLRSVGKVVSSNRTQFVAESVLYDGSGSEVGRGSGIFVRSRMKLREAMGYGTE